MTFTAKRAALCGLVLAALSLQAQAEFRYTWLNLGYNVRPQAINNKGDVAALRYDGINVANSCKNAMFQPLMIKNDGAQVLLPAPMQNSCAGYAGKMDINDARYVIGNADQGSYFYEGGYIDDNSHFHWLKPQMDVTFASSGGVSMDVVYNVNNKGWISASAFAYDQNTQRPYALLRL